MASCLDKEGDDDGGQTNLCTSRHLKGFLIWEIRLDRPTTDAHLSVSDGRPGWRVQQHQGLHVLLDL